MARGRAKKRMMPLAVAAMVVAVLLPAAALALSCPPRQSTLKEAYDAADSIVVGQVTECEETDSRSAWTGGSSGCSFVSLEVLKHASPARDYGGMASTRECGLSLHAGTQYLLFLDNENRPLHYSAPLSGGGNLAKLAGGYLRSLRDFRDGASRELPEPWIAGRADDLCIISHRVGGHSITFVRSRADAPAWQERGWTRDTLDGRTVYRNRLSTGGPDLETESMEVIATEDYSRLTSDMQLLEVSIEDWQPAASRQTTLSIGPQVWPLGRTDTVFVHAGREISRLVAYQLFGDVTDDILSALLRPSDVVVSAKLVTDPNADPQVPEPAPTGNVAVRSGGGTPTRGFGGEEPPPAVLRFETRSTQLASAIEEYRACYDGP